MPATVAETTLRLLESLPPFMQDAPEIQTVLDVLAREVDRIDAARADLIDNYFPATADQFIHLLESLIDVGAVAPTGAPLEVRRAALIAYFRGLSTSGRGVDWEQAMTALVGSSWSYHEYEAGG